MQIERRTFNRIDVNSALRYQIKGTQSFSNTVLRDYSEGGIGFLSNEYFPRYSKLIFEFVPPNSGILVKFIGEVIWTKFQPYSERFLVGIKFVEPALEAQSC